jgi:hypothetical protein
MKDMKEEGNNEVENLKKYQYEINSSICHITNRVEQVENRVSGTEDKRGIISNSKISQKLLIWMENPRHLVYHEKTKSTNMGLDEGEEKYNKGTDNLSNRIIAENFPNLEKERVIQVQEAYRT